MRAFPILPFLVAATLAMCACAVEGTDFPSQAETDNNGFNGNNGNNGGGNNGANNGNNLRNNGFENNGNGNNVGAPDPAACFLLDDRVSCEVEGCLWLTPGCDTEADAFPAACHPPTGCDQGAYDCPDGLVCGTVVYDPCLPQDGGDQCEACGAELQACAPPNCPTLDAASCETSGCRYLQPGCTAPALPEAGCFDLDDCETDDDCRSGSTCQTTGYDPCAGEDCDACGATARLCLP